MSDLPPLSEIDTLLAGVGDLGDDDGIMVRWHSDRPFLPAEAYEMARLHVSDPNTAQIAYSACTMRDAARQLRMQGEAFQTIALALLARDANRLPALTFPGSGVAEARRLLELDDQILISDPAVKASMRAEVEALSAKFTTASASCHDAATFLEEVRRTHHHERLALRALALTGG